MAAGYRVTGMVWHICATFINQTGPPTAVIHMNQIKRQILRIIGQKAAARAAALSGEYIRAKPEEKEAIIAGIDFERWLSEISEVCLD